MTGRPALRARVGLDALVVMCTRVQNVFGSCIDVKAVQGFPWYLTPGTGRFEA
ncbi:hypothetical protein BH10PSE18_BH10PSE18_30020 [soil metagenome]